MGVKGLTSLFLGLSAAVGDRNCRMFMYCWIRDRAVTHQLSLGSYEEKKKVNFVFICDLIKNNLIRSHLMNVFFFFRFSLATGMTQSETHGKKAYRPLIGL